MNKLNAPKVWMVIAIAAVMASQPTGAGAEMLWLNAANGYAGRGSRLEVSQVDGNGLVELRAEYPGNFLWFHIPTVVPSNIRITAVQVCYELSDPASFISQIRLTEMREPTSAAIKIDNGTDRTDPGPVCVTTSPPGFFYPIGSAEVGLALSFADTEDTIRIGGIALIYEYPVVDAPDVGPSSGLALRQNYPNPFASSTSIEFQVAEPGLVEVQVYQPTGRLVRTLAAGMRSPGIERVVWDGKDDEGQRLPAGVYFYRVRVGDETGAKRMIMVR